MPVSPSGAKTLLRDYWKLWLAESHLRPTSRETYERHGKNHILPVFGHRPLGALRRNEIQAWVNRLPVAPRTVVTILAVFQSCLKAAVMDELLPKLIAVGVRAPAAVRRRLMIPTAADLTPSRAPCMAAMPWPSAWPPRLGCARARYWAYG